eukprot:TRINITY_DN3778_c0_g1_i1.p1 TRINITY_DN3778_c0_g1~~TRINITY_DN3778_c0_g1_i1.p1  ORF type:complete len:153 (-),score=45.96 TRINITY_DN3778_c0_g1_i1:223-681(-)
MGRKVIDEEKIRLKELKTSKKKRWRETMYGKKNKVEDWKAQNRKRLEHRYFKVLKKEGIDKKSANLAPLGGDKKNYRKIKEDYKKRQEVAEKKAKKDAKEQKFQEKQAARESYKKKKAERYKVLCKKTHRGQPLMRDRMKMLYEQVKDRCQS